MRASYSSGWGLLFGVVLVSASAPGCGGGLEETRAEPAAGEEDQLRAREWHERAVRLEGEATSAAERGEPCPSRCMLGARTCELAHQICELADDGYDEGTRVLCEDARARCERAESAGATCGCGEGAAPSS